MGLRLFIFNPEHDMALGNGSENFMPSKTIERFKQENATIMSILASEGDIVLLPGSSLSEIDLASISEVVPWGWNAHLVKRLRKAGLRSELYPSSEWINEYRELSHRRTALKLSSSLGHSDGLEINDTKQLEIILEREKDLVLKSPWSGSGRGLRWCHKTLSESDRGWCIRTINTQGSIIAEKRHKVIQDFALLFKGDDFIGYSLFKTKNGAYISNAQLTDKQIREKLSSYINLQELDDYQDKIKDFISKNIVPTYNGHLGVDMYVYEDSSTSSNKLRPVVEINLRYTMGHLAHKKINTTFTP